MSRRAVKASNSRRSFSTFDSSANSIRFVSPAITYSGVVAGALAEHLLRHADRVQHQLVQALAGLLQLPRRRSSRTRRSSLPANCSLRKFAARRSSSAE